MKDGAVLEGRGLFVAEGRLVVRTLLARGRFPVRSVLVNEASFEAIGDALERLPDDVPVRIAGRHAMDAVLGFRHHQGCLAIGERAAAWGPVVPREGPSLVLVLEDLADADNVGAAFRSAHAFGADAVLLSGRCCDPLYRKAIRTSMGAALVVPFRRLDHWPALLAASGHEVFALTPDPSATALADVVPRGDRIAVVAGTEGEGLSAWAIALSDRRVRIPMAPGADSLNVATAAAIAMYALRERAAGR